MNNLKIKLGQRIKSLRKNLNITQETLAELINMDITSLSKIETGRNYPQPETIEKIANAVKEQLNPLYKAIFIPRIKYQRRLYFCNPQKHFSH